MAPSPNLLWVNSRPTGETTDAQWTQWYNKEHLPDLVSHHASTRATFYKETHEWPGGAAAEDRHESKYLALYQSDFVEPLKSKEYLGIRTTSEILPSKVIHEAGTFNARNYKVIQVYDPKNTGEVAPKFILTVEMRPTDVADFDGWYRKEHLELLSKIPGYRRSQRYELGPVVPVIGLGEPAEFLTVHEFDFLSGFDGPEAATCNGTEWTARQIKDAKIFIVRAFELVHAEGFGK